MHALPTLQTLSMPIMNCKLYATGTARGLAIDNTALQCYKLASPSYLHT